MWIILRNKLNGRLIFSCFVIFIYLSALKKRKSAPRPFLFNLDDEESDEENDEKKEESKKDEKKSWWNYSYLLIVTNEPLLVNKPVYKLTYKVFIRWVVSISLYMSRQCYRR